MFAPVVGAGFLAIMPLLFLIIFYFLSFDIFGYLDSILETIMLMSLLYSLWLLLVIIFLTVKWTKYYLDVWFITNIRLVDVEQVGLFSRKVKSLRLERVQDISVEIRGFIATMLSFGDIHVQTAGASRKIILFQAKDPYEVKKDISTVIEEISKNKPFHSIY